MSTVNGDSVRIPLADNSVGAVITSPPYYKMRVYHDLPTTTFADGWVGHLGQEPEPEQFAAHMAEIFTEIKRVVHPEGLIYMVMGDKWAGSGGAGGDYNKKGLREGQPRFGSYRSTQYRPKEQIGVPWLVGSAIRAISGLYIRQEIIWAKGRDGCDARNNFGRSYPSSVKDRPVYSHETIFLFTASPSYGFDYFDSRVEWEGGSHALRSVWLIDPRPSGKGKHFAAFPPELVKQMLRTVPKNACSRCAAPYDRVYQRRKIQPNVDEAKQQRVRHAGNMGGGVEKVTLGRNFANYGDSLGWEPRCDCKENPVPTMVFDPFAGTGTTGEAAKDEGFRYVGLELSPTYVSTFG